MSWIFLILAGLLEIAWAVGLKFTDGFTRLVPSILVGSAIVGSMTLLALAVRSLPIATAYAVWVGIGIAGTALVEIFYFRNPVSVIRLLFLTALIVSIAGLKLTSSGTWGK